MNNIVIILGFVVYMCSISMVIAQQYRGDICVIRNSKENGVCDFLPNCRRAVDDLKKGIYPTRCGFEGNQIVVCCPQDTPPKPETPPKRTPGEISKTMCANYSQYVWTVELSPLLLVGAEDIKKRDCPFDKLELVVGGEPASRKEFPHMAQLGYEGNPIPWSCGGSLISDQYILTAAHCLDDRSLGEPRYARMGMVDVDNPDHVQEFNITERIGHPDYDDASHYHDIGLVKLHAKATLNTWVRPACLYTSTMSPWTNVIATGWGKTDFGGFESIVLRRVVLELYDQAKCDRVYKQESGTIKLSEGIKDELMICAGHSKEFRDTCQGDSGGPLQVYKTENKNVTCMYDIIGVTSFGKGCGLAVNIPGVYTRVARYLEWIEDRVWPAK